MATSNVAPPHISRRKDCGSRCDTKFGDRQHVVGADARGQQRLVGVAERRVGEQQPLLLATSTRRTSRGPARAAAGACRRAAALRIVRRDRRGAVVASGAACRATGGLPLTITSAEVGQQLGGAVLRAA